ncbi:MAG: hypothetical protein HEQ35_24895 [Gloeotrichia echinulata IR180]|nr:hypothetical protein [Gloeotrichia echinulata DEX184]
MKTDPIGLTKDCQIFRSLLFYLLIPEEYIIAKEKLGAKYLVGSFNFVESYNLVVDDNQKQKINYILNKYPNLVKDGTNFIAQLKRPENL